MVSTILDLPKTTKAIKFMNRDATNIEKEYIAVIFYAAFFWNVKKTTKKRSQQISQENMDIIILTFVLLNVLYSKET